MDEEAEYVVIGAGLAGLTAARALHQLGAKVIVLEAGSIVGGRVAQLHGFAPWPLQLGAEFVHGGENNVLVRLFERLQWSYRTLEWPDRYYFGPRSDETNDERFENDDNDDNDDTALHGIVDATTAEAHPDIAEAHRLLADLPDAPWVLETESETSASASQIPIDDLESSETKHVDCTALRWLTDRVKASKRVIAVAENVYANDFGCSLSTMGMRETAVEQREWCHGEEYILLDEGRHLGDLVREVSSGLDVRLETVARTVEWSRKEKETNGNEGVTGSFNDGGAAVKTRCGKTFRASVAIIVAAPMSALKETHWSPAFATKLLFDPPLPRAKRDAIDAIQMSDAVKICLAFRETFWPKDIWNVVCCDAFLPECWMLEYDAAENENENESDANRSDVAGRAIVTFFACGETAKAVARRIREDPERGEAGVVEQALEQLDAMFGGDAGGARGDAAPATKRFVAAKVFPWSAVDSVGGAYTHPSVYAAGARRELQKPEYDGALFFAGEAANVKCNPCMQGAMTTGLEAAAAAAAERAARTGTPLPEGFGEEDWFVECFGSDSS